MSKLSKQQAKAHKQALELVRSGRPLSERDKAFVFANFHEGAEHMNGLAGAYFTPWGLARDFAIEVHGWRILDLCAGIGMLSYACEREDTTHVCVEKNGDYIEVGRAVMPRATWVHASAFDLEAYQHLGPFDVVISNPPFGQIPADGFVGKYTGGLFEFRIIELASKLAPRGVFIVPQMSAPFQYSGRDYFEMRPSDKYERFHEQTGIVLEMNCGIDTSTYKSEWHGVSPICEIVCCEFEGLLTEADLTVRCLHETQHTSVPGGAQLSLFEVAE